jgi:hypothetical protein
MFQSYCTSVNSVSANYMSFFVAGKTTLIDLAFSEIVKHQIELTKHFINSQQRMYQAYCTSVENMSANYKPVTLEDTKQVSCLYSHSCSDKQNMENYSEYVAASCDCNCFHTLRHVCMAVSFIFGFPLFTALQSIDFCSGLSLLLQIQ